MNFTRLPFFLFLGAATAWTCGSGLAQQNQTPPTTGGTMRRMPRMDMPGMKMGTLGSSTYQIKLELTPPAIVPEESTQLKFSFLDPQGLQATRFQVMHEKLFHLFIVSEDLEYFLHDHPVLQADGTFLFDATFPRSGMFRILADIYPEGAAPQLIAETVYAGGAPQTPASLTRDYGPKDGQNLQTAFRTVPEQPIAGQTTQLRFHISPSEGLEQYLAAWGHMLVASDDTIDLIHAHPFIADGGPDVQFNVTFPRERTYRVWVQFQRLGKVSTLRFDVPVGSL